MAVKLDDRCGGERLGTHYRHEVLFGECGARYGAVPVGANAGRRAAGQRVGCRGERGHHFAAAQSLGRHRLIGTQHFEARPGLPCRSRECRDEPGRQRIGVHDDRDEGSTSWALFEFDRHIGRDPLNLVRGAEHSGSCACGRDRPSATQEHGSCAVLHRAHALADRGGCDVQPLRGALETPLLDNGGEGLQVFDGKVHFPILSRANEAEER